MSVDLSALTRRQRECLDGIILGKSRKLIARELGITSGTMNKHVAQVYSKLNVHDDLSAAVAGFRGVGPEFKWEGITDERRRVIVEELIRQWRARLAAAQGGKA